MKVDNAYEELVERSREIIANSDDNGERLKEAQILKELSEARAREIEAEAKAAESSVITKTRFAELGIGIATLGWGVVSFILNLGQRRRMIDEMRDIEKEGAITTKTSSFLIGKWGDK